MEPTGKTSEEVKIPKLELNRQNWKIYCTKIVKAAATDIMDLLGVLAGWKPDDRSYNWECQDAILKWSFYTSVPISILHPIQKLDTAHKIFKYLMKCFWNNDPIPCANKFQCAGTATAVETSENYPTSANTGTEWHVNTKRDKEDLSNTQDLTWGMEDPCASLETLAKGNSTKSADGTLVLLKGMLHETWNKLQNPLWVTPQRLPIVGEPCECKQEVVNSIVMAECMNGMVQSAKPNEMDADIDRVALPGREGPYSWQGWWDRVQLPKTESFCEERHQHNKNATENLPSTYKLLLKGEWAVYPSGKISNSRNDANVSNMAIEHVNGPSESRVTEDALENESEGCKGSTDEPMELLTMSVEPYVKDGSDILCVYLESWADASGCQMDGAGIHADALTGNGDIPGIKTKAIIPENALEKVSIPWKKDKPPNSPVEAARQHSDESNGLGDAMVMLSVHADVYSVRNERKRPANETESISMCQMDAQMRNLPYMPEIVKPELARRWRKVSVKDIDIYVPWSIPVEVLGWMFAFGWLKRRRGGCTRCWGQDSWGCWSCKQTIDVCLLAYISARAHYLHFIVH